MPLFNDEVMIRSQQQFRSDHHRVYTEEVNKIALSSNDDKRLQTFDKITTFPYGATAIIVCESEMLSKNKLIGHDEDKNRPKDKDKDNTTTKTKTEDQDNTTTKTKTEDKDSTSTKTEDKDNTTTKTEDKDNTITKTKTKIEDKDEDIDKGRNVYRCFGMQSERKIKKVIEKKPRSFGSFGMKVMYLNYVKSGYAITITMHTQGLKSFEHVLVRCFLLENIRQPHQKINQTPT